MVRMIRPAILSLVLAALLVPAAFALPRASRPAPSHPAGLSAVWEWMVSLFLPSTTQGSGAGIVEKEGSQMDPNGAAQSGTIYSGPTTDAGSSMDPDGVK